MRRSGFTLIELLVVVAIIVILAGAMIPLFSGVQLEAREARATADLDTIRTACIMYHHDMHDWPLPASEEVGLVTGTGITGWEGPYLDEWRDDPWENDYALFASGTALWSRCMGSDGLVDTGGETGGEIDIERLVTPNIAN